MGYSSNRKKGVVPLEYACKRHHHISRDMKFGLNHLSNPYMGFKSSSSHMADPKGKGTKCFKCQQPGHMVYNCPRKNLYICLESEEEPEPPKQEENGNSFDYGAYDLVDLDDEELDGQLASVVSRILAVPKVEEDWCRTSIFQMLVRCGNQAQKLIVDSGSCMNVVSASTIERLKLLVEPHPQPYKVA